MILFILIAAGVVVSKTTGGLSDGTRPNVIFISLDTLRADHVFCYNKIKKQTSPNIDKIAKEGYIFEKAYSTTSWTLPAHASMMTGLFPSSHNADRSDQQTFRRPLNPLPQSAKTLAEVLSDNGYLTAGVISVPLLSSAFGMDQGFQYYDEKMDPFEDFKFLYLNEYSMLIKVLKFTKIINKDYADGQKRVTEVNAKGLKWIENNKDRNEPFFFFLHYFEPHYVYEPPNPYDLRDDGSKIDYFLEMETLNHGLFSLSRSGIEDLVTLYDGEIEYLDHHLGKLFDTLKQWGILDNTLLIITSDHGESFNEHEVWTHGNRLYQEQIHVPLIVRYPKLVPANHIDTKNIVQLVDLMPTILDVLKIPIPEYIQGRSLLPIFQNESDLRFNMAFAELKPDIIWKSKNSRFGHGIMAIIRGEWKYILPDTGMEELYNIDIDPFENQNLASNEMNLTKELRSILLTWHHAVNQSSEGDSGQIDARRLKQLRALGYLK
jgi:arylsulfatase A-like enzyme